MLWAEQSNLFLELTVLGSTMLLEKKKRWIKLNGGEGIQNISAALSPLPYSGTPIDDAKYEKLSGLFLSDEVKGAPRFKSSTCGLVVGSGEKSNVALKTGVLPTIKTTSVCKRNAVKEGVSVHLIGSLSLGPLQVIDGTWAYSNSSSIASRQQFQLKCDTTDENATSPQGGVFRGSFTLPRATKNRSGRVGETERLVIEDDVKLTFSCRESGNQYVVKGSGSNELGVFALFGIAVKVAGKDRTFDIKLKKTYLVPAQSEEAGVEPKKQAPPVKLFAPSKENIANVPCGTHSGSATKKSIPLAPTRGSIACAAKRSRDRSELMGRKAPSLMGEYFQLSLLDLAPTPHTLLMHSALQYQESINAIGGRRGANRSGGRQRASPKARPS